MELKDIEKTENEIMKTQAKIEYYQQRQKQLEHQITTIENRTKEELRKSRTHRLIVRGAILESLIPNAEKLSDEQIKHILVSMIGAIPDKLRKSLFE